MTNRVIASAWLATAALLGSAAWAVDDKKPHVDPGDEKVCVRPKTTGSRIRPQPICRTKAEWAIAEKQQQQGMDKVMREIQHPQLSNGPF